MKYLLTSVLAIIGIFFIVIGLTAPSTLAVVSISQSTSQSNLSVTSVPYPSSTSSSSPTLFPGSSSANISISFTTGYFTSDNIQIVSSSGTLYIDGSPAVLTPHVNAFVNSRDISGTYYYAIFVNMTDTYNNPTTGSMVPHSFLWSASVTYEYTSSSKTGTAIGSSSTYYGAFSPSTVYPGYFVMQFTYPSNSTTQDWVMNQNTKVNLVLPSSTTFPITLTFIYVEYNASGNTMNGFGYAYITINSNSAPYDLSSANTTTYNNYNGLSINIKFNTGTYTIDGYAVYNYGQNGGLDRLMSIAMPFNITTPNTMWFTTQSFYELGLGAIFLIGAVFTGRRRL
jgi:hypothetical protein